MSLAHTTELRVRYAETDQGGVVYNSNYLVYFEVGRTELMRQLGFPYAELEQRGFVMPVVEAHVNYRAPARYDDLLLVDARIAEVRRVRLRIDSTVRLKSSGRTLAEGWIWLACTGEGGRPCPLPEDVCAVLQGAGGAG